MDPASPEPTVALAMVADATDRVLADARSLSDADVTAASALPEWSRGHVLTHLARNAEALHNLLITATTGERLPMYASRERRNTDIEAGADRSRAELTADVTETHRQFVAAADRVTDWSASVFRTADDPGIPAWWVPLLRLGELEIHHTDLDVAYGFDRWPSDWAVAYLPYATTELSDRAGEPLALRATDGDGRVEAAEPGARTVEGPQRSLLAWVTGRHDGGDLTVAPDGPLPAIGSWR